jgi:hypothetical protein
MKTFHLALQQLKPLLYRGVYDLINTEPVCQGLKEFQ